MRESGGTHCGSFIVDRLGTVLGFDQEMEALTGWPAVDVVGRSKEFGSSLLPNKAGDGPLATPALYEGQIPVLTGARKLQLRLNCRDGRRLEADADVSRLPGAGERMLVTVLRILARSAERGEPGAVPSRDWLTGLLDRDAFANTLAECFRVAAETARPLALVLGDIDHLREVNDRFGHQAGDDLLQKLAGILRVSLDDEELLFRVGEDDFAVLLPSAGRGEARQLAASLRSTVDRHRFFPEAGPDRGVHVTLSLGAASYPADAETPSDLFSRAVEALDEARTMGRNRVWCYLRRPRVPCEIPVYFDGVEQLLVGYTRDLSPSGVFVQTASPMGIGMRCALTFRLPGDESKVHVIGRVVRTVPPEIESAELRVPGMGVEFERFSGTRDRRAIDTFLHHHESRTSRPENGILSLG
ncbi:MAG TPA: diguanylate cyclase [Candidatus Polarisedimenticolaceae bacterium]|nr:diguanylate cyclase [Candidatus Polarisedimenticolaceae bacterium]